MSEEYDGVTFLEANNQFFDGLGGFRIEGTGGFIRRNDIGPNGECPGEAKTLCAADIFQLVIFPS